MGKKRKPLNDALANSFVYGETEPNIKEVEKVETEKTPNNQTETETTSTKATELTGIQNTEKQAMADREDSFLSKENKNQKKLSFSVNSDNTVTNLPTNHLANKTQSMIEKLQLKPKEATKRFTVDLSESQHRKLSILAAKTGRTKADIVRMLLGEALGDITD